MDWLLKHNVIRSYLQTNFREKEFKKAIKYTLIIGIQTLYQLHGNSSTDPHVSFTLEQLSSMIVSNNGTLQVQADLPALNKCLKDIKSQLGDIQNELDTRVTTQKVHTTSAPSNTQKYVTNIIKTNPSNVPNTKKNKPKSKPSKSGNNIHKTSNKTLNKANKTQTNAVYPEWWPEYDTNEECDETQEEDEPQDIQHDDNEALLEAYNEPRPAVQHPNIYNQPIAFSIPKQQFAKDTDGNIVQLHVNLYPEYMQKCMDTNAIHNCEINDDHQLHENQDRKRNITQKKKRKIKSSKRGKNNRSKSLTRCTESSQAKASGNRPQSSYLKSMNRSIAPCLKYPKPKAYIKRNKEQKSREKRRKSFPNKSSKNVPKYLKNVESRIKGELKRDKRRNKRNESERESMMRNIAKFGLSENENDQYYDEWKEHLGYDQIGCKEILKPSVISVADAMAHSDIIQAMNPSFAKEPTLITGDLDNNEHRAMLNKENQSSLANDSFNMNFVSNLRDWASGLTTNEDDEQSH